MEPLIVPFKRSNKVCTICFKSFKDENKLSEHKMLCSIGVKQEADLEIEDDFSNVPESSTSVFDKKDEAEKQITFKCDECKLTFFELEHLQSHKKTHMKYKCTNCDGKIFTSRKDLVAHRVIHPKTALTKRTCKLCGKVLCSKPALKSHLKPCRVRHRLRSSRKLRCEQCNLVFKMKRSLDHHSKIHEHGIACRFCDKMFKCGANLLNHEFVHIENSPSENELQEFEQHIKIFDKYSTIFECRFCPKKCLSWSNIYKHLKLHRNPRPERCLICFASVNYTRKGPYSSIKKPNKCCFLCLENHVAGHFEEREKEELTCTFCENVLSCKKSLQIHEKICPKNVSYDGELVNLMWTMEEKSCRKHRTKIDDAMECYEPTDESIENRSIMNDIIKDEYSEEYSEEESQESTLEHYLVTKEKEHIEKDSIEMNESNLFDTQSCEFCSKIFTIYELNSHLKKCKTFVCIYKDCPLLFENTESRSIHHQMHENGFNCRICGMSFKRIHPYLNHEYGHIDEGPDENELRKFIEELQKLTSLKCTCFGCKFCFRQFHSYDKIILHLEFHKNPSPKNCLICMAPVIYDENHFSVHPKTKQGPYDDSCDLCLEAHMATHFQESFKEKLKCVTCKNVFSCRKSLEIHRINCYELKKPIFDDSLDIGTKRSTRRPQSYSEGKKNKRSIKTVNNIKQNERLEKCVKKVLDSSKIKNSSFEKNQHTPMTVIAPKIKTEDVNQIEASQSYTVTAPNIESEGYISNITVVAEHSEVVQPINTTCINSLQNTRYYCCKLCVVSFVSIDLLDKHEERHNSPYLYKCQECPQKFSTILKYKKHLLEHF